MAYHVHRAYSKAQSFISDSGIGDTKRNIANRLEQLRQYDPTYKVKILTIGPGNGNFEAEIRREFGSQIELHSVDKDISQVLPKNRAAFDQLTEGEFESTELSGNYDLIISVYGTNGSEADQSFTIAEKIWNLLALEGEAFFMLHPSSGIPALDMLIKGSANRLFRMELEDLGIIFREYCNPMIPLANKKAHYAGIYLNKQRTVPFTLSYFSTIASRVSKTIQAIHEQYDSKWKTGRYSAPEIMPKNGPCIKFTRNGPWHKGDSWIRESNILFSQALKFALEQYPDEWARTREFIRKVFPDSKESDHPQILVDQYTRLESQLWIWLEFAEKTGLPLDEVLEDGNFKGYLPPYG